ncbi:LuxR family transcriptional regulator [Streptomyces sp. NPDC050704]|uniref:LuxR family transcriptional regulator n=1 Tax=Streptomyces sp. NPDC050704 TaxID=3157219 RepID=UPI0034155FA0
MYRAALREGRVPADEVPRCLTELGLVVADADAPGFCLPVSPDAARFAVLTAMEDELAEQRRAVRSTSSRLAAFESVYAREQRDARPALVRLTEKAVINAALEAAVGDCRHELLTAQPGGGRAEATLREAFGRDLRALRRGVRQRTLYQHTVHTHRPTMAYIERVTEAGAEVRTLAEVVERLIVCDRSVAFIPLSDDAADGALQIWDPALVRFLVRVFEQTWERSTPIHPADTAERRSPVVASDLQQTILRAVVSGETDSSIARRLGMSRRSVAEHLRKASVLLGSGSRAQLGYLVATSGLLEERDD